MLTVYVAGPYGSDNVIGVLDNQRNGLRTCYEILKLGMSPFVPWFDYLFSFMGPVTIEEYYAYSMAWLERSDAVLVLPGWRKSKGTLAEIAQAEELGIPVFYKLGDLLRWKDEQETNVKIFSHRKGGTRGSGLSLERQHV